MKLSASHIIMLVVALFSGGMRCYAAPTDSVSQHKISINFVIDRWDINPSFADNAARLQELHNLFDDVRSNPLARLDSLLVSGYSSPDGSLPKNCELSLRRAVSLRNYLVDECQVPDSLMRFGANEVPWDEFRKIIGSSDYPWRDEAMSIINIGSDDNTADNTRRMNRLKRLAGGEAWRVLKADILPRLRAAYVLTAVITHKPEPVIVEPEPVVEDTVVVVDEFEEIEVGPRGPKPFYMDIRTNMLFDVAAVPNLGVDFYLGKNYTIGANWMYG